MIEVSNIQKTFKIIKKQPGIIGNVKALFRPEFIYKEAVKNISFRIDEGELVGYIGQNGAGKSTTIKILCGILYPDKGTVKVNGIEPFINRKVNNKNIGVVFGQRGQLWRDLQVEDSFMMLKNIYEVSDEDYEKRMGIFDEYLNIKELLHMPVRKLSLGQKMKCEFVAALIHWPKVLYLDEPTIGVDIITRKKLLKFIEMINNDYKITVILTTHNMQDIESLCKRVIIINEGEIIFDGDDSKLKKLYGGYKKLNIKFEEEIKDTNNGSYYTWKFYYNINNFFIFQ